MKLCTSLPFTLVINTKIYDIHYIYCARYLLYEMGKILIL